VRKLAALTSTILNKIKEGTVALDEQSLQPTFPSLDSGPSIAVDLVTLARTSRWPLVFDRAFS
jgi:hypothetical protein